MNENMRIVTSVIYYPEKSILCIHTLCKGTFRVVNVSVEYVGSVLDHIGKIKNIDVDSFSPIIIR